jgi:hypothetical protein
MGNFCQEIGQNLLIAHDLSRTPASTFSGSCSIVELQIKTAELPVKYAEIACESACFGFDGKSASLYVERS